MSDLFDLLGNVGKRKSNQQNEDPSSADDGLDFLTGFKKKVQSGEPIAKRKGSHAEGITTLDIADLPEPYKTIMMALLRDKEANAGEGLTVAEVQGRVGNIDQLSDALEELVLEQYLVAAGSGVGKRYRVNLRPKKGRLGNLLSSLDE